jgi:hypothetical protein
MSGMLVAAVCEVSRPIRPLLQDGYFTPEDVTVLIEVFEQALRDLRLADRNDPAVELVAKRIIALATPGQRNPKLLRMLC